MARSRTRLVLAVLGAAALPALVACNAIIGLSDFEKRECAGLEPCPFDGGPDVQTDRNVPEGGADADGGKPPRGADPVSWPAFPMPNYKDASVTSPPAPRPLRYTPQVDTTIKDEHTGLVWQKAPAQGAANLDFDKSLEACNALTPQGTWRVPKRIELVTLLDYGRSDNLFIDETTFTVNNVRAWTSSEARPFDPSEPVYWIVDFGDGRVKRQRANLSAVALCVKGI